MRLFGLIGYPLTHSFSKKYFEEKFEKEQIAGCRYELFPIKTIEELLSLLNKHPELEGLNVTIPYKKQVMAFLDESNIPAGLGACNCVNISGGRLIGYNTDVTGFGMSLKPLLKSYHKKALVLGSGGAANAVAYVLQKLGIGFNIVSRKIQDDATIGYADIDRNVIHDHSVIINTTPLGTFPDTDTCPDIPYQYIGQEHLLFDLVYNPSKTLFLKKGEERGAVIKNGEEMLVLQAEESWRIWNS
ncbi:MAG: shikimate dehydrogenase [Sphingobacteriales bacterium]|nr:shikimate dehydrogenase [Sphingobacteriales bacterium]